MIADGVVELQSYIDDVLPEEKPLYNEITDAAFYFEDDDETINNDAELVIKMRKYDFEGREERLAG